MANLTVNKPSGGVLSFLGLVAGAVFLGLAVFGVPVDAINEVDAGLFSWGIAFVLERLSL